MRSTFITFLISCFCFTFLAAQAEKPAPKHSIKAGFGTAYLNTGNYFGKQRYVEYDRRLFNLMSVGINASHTAAAQKKSSGFEQSTKAYQGEMTLFVSPINNEVNSLKFGVGGAYRHSVHRFNSFTDSQDDTISKEFFENVTNSKGLSVMLEYEVFIARHLLLGSRASYQRFDNAERVFYFGLNAGIRF